MTDFQCAGWCIHPAALFYWREWEGQYVFYEKGSGETLLLEEVAASIILLLQQSNESTPANVLAQSLADKLNYLFEEEFISHVNETLKQLELREFIERVEI